MGVIDYIEHKTPDRKSEIRRLPSLANPMHQRGKSTQSFDKRGVDQLMTMITPTLTKKKITFVNPLKTESPSLMSVSSSRQDYHITTPPVRKEPPSLVRRPKSIQMLQTQPRQAIQAQEKGDYRQLIAQ